MATIFLDSSAAFRRYYQPEAGANRVRELCAPSRRNVLLIARIAPVEVASAFARRVRDGTLPAPTAVRRAQQLRLHVRHQYQIVPATDAVYVLAERLVGRHPLRSLDALQLATALTVAARGVRLQFWTADRQQAAAARAEGLGVEVAG